MAEVAGFRRRLHLPISPTQFVAAKRRLSMAVVPIAAMMRDKFASLKAEAAAWNHPHFIWNALLQSFGTMGNSRGAALVKDPKIRATVQFNRLRKLTLAARAKAIREALYAAKVRMPDRKTEWLMENFDRIVAEGGPAKVKAKLESCPGRDAKIAYLRSFRGIGDKYARNILMDVYHPDFRDSIAYDERLKKVSKALGVEFGGDYHAAERFFLEVAHMAGLNGWELDRLLYWETERVIRALEGGRGND